MLGSIIGAIGSLAGGFFGNKQADKQAALQKEFAQNSIQWRARDAEKAGISKVFAMGAPTVSYSPVSTGGMGDSIASAGRQLGAGIDGQLGPHSTTTGKVSGIGAQIASAQLDGLRIDNNIKRAELASKLNIATQPGAGGVMDHSVPFGPEGIKAKKEISPASPDAPQRSFGVSPEVDLYQTNSGLAPVPNKELAELHENNAFLRWQWMARNHLLPFMYDDRKSAPPAPIGSYYTFNPMTGEYSLNRKTNFHRNYEDWWMRRSPQEHRR